MKERPILFSAPMVRALLAGTKTQTRRVVKPQPAGEIRRGEPGVNHWIDSKYWLRTDQKENRGIGTQGFACPYGQPGDRLWVRETWSPSGPEPSDGSLYRADFPEGPLSIKFKPSIHMPRWASRITLEITSVRVERLHDISEADAAAEGLTFSAKARRSEGCMGIYELRMPDGKLHFNDNARDLFRTLWEQINGPASWDANPWVWVVSFQPL